MANSKKSAKSHKKDEAKKKLIAKPVKSSANKKSKAAKIIAVKSVKKNLTSAKPVKKAPVKKLVQVKKAVPKKSVGASPKAKPVKKAAVPQKPVKKASVKKPVKAPVKAKAPLKKAVKPLAKAKKLIPAAPKKISKPLVAALPKKKSPPAKPAEAIKHKTEVKKAPVIAKPIAEKTAPAPKKALPAKFIKELLREEKPVKHAGKKKEQTPEFEEEEENLLPVPEPRKKSHAKTPEQAPQIEELEDIDFSEEEMEPEIKPKRQRKSKEKDEDKNAAAQRAAGSKNDTMKVYMQDIGQISLVSKEEEVDLAAKIHGEDMKQHDEARATLIQANLRLVVKIAHDFKGLGLPLLDLISEGNIGLMRAVEKFDPAKGAKFSSYAAWWIKQSMRRALANQSRTIRIPVQSAGKINKIKSVRMKLTEELGREPTDAEIAGHLDFSERTVAGLRLADLRTFSLHDPIQQGEDGEFQDIIPDRGAMTPDRILGDVESVDRLMDLLLDLDNRERMILKMRFGLDGSRPRTLEEVSQQIGRTRERVRQIQNQALNKLRSMLADEAGFASE